MHIQAIPMAWGTGDNYAYIIKDDATNEATVVDPAQAHEVLPVLEKQIDAGTLKLTSITNTHHHLDHSGGNGVFKLKYPSIPLIAGKDSKFVTKTPAEGEKYKIGANIQITALHTPCHTQDSICYFAEDLKTGDKAVFTGDTLFNAGCGRFFEGSAQEMYYALRKLAALPKETKVYTGHEYTKSNAKFAVKVLPTEPVQRLIKYCEQHEKTAGVFTIGDELQHNPFMLTDDKELQARIGVNNPVEAMETLRELKNKG